ncbi:MAG: phage holin family protein [Candidatus Dormibacteraeota bacterium]|nr:phage holin family protein [Candidatus Dormibacteraeota bacterium]
MDDSAPASTDQRQIEILTTQEGISVMNADSVRIHETTRPTDDDRTSEPSTIELVRDAVDKGTGLIADEVRLAKQELAETVRGGVAVVVGGALAAFGVIGFLIMAVVTVITVVPVHWAAAAGFSLLFLAVAIVAALFAARQLRRTKPMQQTTETIKEDVQWAKQQLTLGEK